jgi:hypothetical protein
VTRLAATQWREFAKRTGNGVEVALLWNQSLNRVRVAVSDERLCHHIDLEINGAESSRAFQQTFAEASSRLLADDLLALTGDR